MNFVPVAKSICHLERSPTLFRSRMAEAEAEVEVEGEEGARPSAHGGGGGGGSSRAICCRELRLYEFPERYVIQSADPDTPDHAFSIGRLDGQVEPLVG